MTGIAAERLTCRQLVIAVNLFWKFAFYSPAVCAYVAEAVVVALPPARIRTVGLFMMNQGACSSFGVLAAISWTTWPLCKKITRSAI